MADFDVFNGDADGICALQQLRLSRPLASTLVTGVKRLLDPQGAADAEGRLPEEFIGVHVYRHI